MKGIIRLCYRKLIDASTQKAWDKAVFDATHMEFYMQAQRIDPEGHFTTFRELAQHTGQGDQLQYLASTAAIGYIRQLNDLMPDLPNALGKLCIPFKNFRFEILQSHLEDKTQHRIAISFYSEPLNWIDTVGNSLLVSVADMKEQFETETELIPMVPYLSISHYKSTISPAESHAYAHTH